MPESYQWMDFIFLVKIGRKPEKMDKTFAKLRGYSFGVDKNPEN